MVVSLRTGEDWNLLVAGRVLEQDPLQLVHRSSADPHRCLESLGAEFPGIEAAPQLVQRRTVLLVDVLPGRLQQEQVAGRFASRAIRA